MNFDSLQRGQAGAFELAEKACPHFSSIFIDVLLVLWWVKSGNHMKPLSVLGNQTTSKKRKFCMLKRLKVVGFVGWLLTPEFRRFKYVFNKILSDNGRSLWECLQLCVPKCCQLSSLSWVQKRLRRCQDLQGESLKDILSQAELVTCLTDSVFGNLYNLSYKDCHIWPVRSISNKRIAWTSSKCLKKAKRISTHKLRFESVRQRSHLELQI